jgi:hypothetical protein
MDSKLGLRFISKMNQQPEYLIASFIESVKQTKQIGVSRLSEYFLFAFDFQIISKGFTALFCDFLQTG